MTIGPIDYGKGPSPVGVPENQYSIELTGDPSLDESIAALQAALHHFTIHSNPASISAVTNAALEVDAAVKSSGLSPEQKEVVLSNLKISILDSGLPFVGSPNIAAEADELFSHILPPTLLDFPSIAALFNQDNHDSPLLAAAGRLDTTNYALEEAKKRLEDDPSNEELKEKVKNLVEKYLNEIFEFRALINEHRIKNEDNISVIGGLKTVLDDISSIIGQ